MCCLKGLEVSRQLHTARRGAVSIAMTLVVRHVFVLCLRLNADGPAATRGRRPKYSMTKHVFLNIFDSAYEA
jgi:hypothetical protein